MFIILEVPHQYPPKAWIAFDEKDFINTVNESGEFTYVEWDLEKAKESYGSTEEIPTVILEILTTGEKAIECMYGGFEVVEPASVADTLFEYAQQANFHDLQFGTILTLDEARAFIGGDRTVWGQYQTPEAKRAVRKLLTDYDLLEAE